MKDLLSKECCCYKVHTFLRSSAYPCSIDNPFYVLPPLPTHPHFYNEILMPPFFNLSKISVPPYVWQKNVVPKGISKFLKFFDSWWMFLIFKSVSCFLLSFGTLFCSILFSLWMTRFLSNCDLQFFLKCSSESIQSLTSSYIAKVINCASPV